ncbi:hypothetical protein [Actinoplanes sp. NPDC023714]|uniref:hypothetical protein n=1 Tax=Actinoplanes sp. NPDC023714 TaxID=3154322 RepID=UPI0033D2521B
MTHNTRRIAQRTALLAAAATAVLGFLATPAQADPAQHGPSQQPGVGAQAIPGNPNNPGNSGTIDRPADEWPW